MDKSAPADDEEVFGLDDKLTGNEADDIETVGSSSSISVYLGTSDYQDPGETLDYLRDVGSEPTVVGPDVVRGAATTHYRTKLDSRAALEHDLEEEGWSRRSIECVLADAQDDPMDVVVWVGDDGLVRRIVTTTVFDAGNGPLHEKITSVDTTDFFDFGVQVNIEPPRVSEVIGVDEWQKLAEQAFEDDAQLDGEGD